MANPKDYPYSALFDYDELAKEEQSRKEKLQSAQTKIMRTNAVGDALRLIIEGIGGSKGATITPRAINPGISMASQRYNALEDQSRSNVDRLRLQDLAMKEKDLSYGLGQEAIGQQRGYESQKIKEQQTFAAGENEKEQAARLKLEQEQNAGALARTKMAGQYDVSRVTEQNEGRIKLEKEKQSRTGSLAKKGLFEVARYDDPSTDAIISRNQALSLIPALKQWLSSKGIKPYQMPRVLQPDVAPTKIQDDQLKILISQYPEFFRARLPELSGGESATAQQPMGNSALFPGGWQLSGGTPYKQGTGPLRSYGAPAKQTAQAQIPAQLASDIFNDAQSIYNKGTSIDQVTKDLKALVNTKYQDATPAEKAEIYNSLIERF